MATVVGTMIQFSYKHPSAPHFVSSIPTPLFYACVDGDDWKGGERESSMGMNITSIKKPPNRFRYTTILRTDVEKSISCVGHSYEEPANCPESNGMPRSRLLANDTGNPQRAGKISPAAKPDRDP
ncbi:hypothetical protein CDAR_29861 [Caerostris darwini]|uniref:Uncharacterized protein n=1 Tax=Caerostris darwini TaxID=1538125 RepID=A0AAV4QQY7_9ARAC|nr:hypothetical protein CDAR_29861 [Caerostris darwini]